MITSGSSVNDSLPVLTSCDSSRCFVLGRHRQNLITRNVTMLPKAKLESIEPIQNERDRGWESAELALVVPSSTPQPWWFRVAKGKTRLLKTERSQRCEFLGQPSMSHVRTFPLYTSRKAFLEGKSLGAPPVFLSMTS